MALAGRRTGQETNASPLDVKPVDGLVHSQVRGACSAMTEPLLTENGIFRMNYLAERMYEMLRPDPVGCKYSNERLNWGNVGPA